MGADLFDRYPVLLARADAVVGYPVADLCRSDAATLARTECCHCATRRRVVSLI